MRRARPVVLLDCDGVLADFTRGMLEEIRAITGESFKPERVDRYNFEKCEFFKVAQESHRIQERRMSVALPEPLERLVWRRISQPGWARGIEAVEGAREAVVSMQKVADVYVVTSPVQSSRTWTHDRTWWLSEKVGVKHTHVIHAADKRLIHGDIFLDDKPDHVAEWSAHNRKGEAFLWDAPYNQDALELTRVSRWSDVVERVESIKASMGWEVGM